MRILDANGNEIVSPDLSAGYLAEEKIFIAHHDRVDEVPEQWHYETTREYPNGGRDVERVIDVPFVEGRDAWDEYEDILRYVPYTQEELEKVNEPSLESRVGALELDAAETREALEMILSGVVE